ncbi:CoA-binding protein [Candidatus Bathyarchaeota archaeon]|nr:CoA-binding protein [Candidatus Bathyarchaeota archaeon]
MTPTNIEEILRTCKTVAVIDLSRSPNKTSHQVAEYLQDQGYVIMVTNPLQIKFQVKRHTRAF